MSLLSKEDREWRRAKRKEAKEHNKNARKTEGTRLAQWLRRKMNEK